MSMLKTQEVEVAKSKKSRKQQEAENRSGKKAERSSKMLCRII